MMRYRGYMATVEYDDSIESLHGFVVNSGRYSIANFYGDTVADLKEEFRISIDEYLASCEEDDVEPVKPFSGEFRLRLGSSLHQQATLASIESGKSLNDWVKSAVEEALATPAGGSRSALGIEASG